MIPPGSDRLPLPFWYVYGVGGLLLWLALGVVWWRVNDFMGAVEIVCRLVAQLTWMIGAAVAAFWLFSFGCAVVLAVLVVPFVSIGWLVDRRRDKTRSTS